MRKTSHNERIDIQLPYQISITSAYNSGYTILKIYSLYYPVSTLTNSPSTYYEFIFNWQIQSFTNKNAYFAQKTSFLKKCQVI